MRCKDCGFANGEDDHRCLRCGRRLAGIVIAAPTGYSGANALALAPDVQPLQPPLFTGAAGTSEDNKVIPFDAILQRYTGRAAPVPVAADKPAPPRTVVKKVAGTPPAEQGSLDFVRAP